MINQVIRICTLIWLSLCCLTTIAFFDEISRLNRDLYFRVSGENETVSLLLNFKDKRSTNQHTLNASLETIEKTFRKKADILSHLLKTHVDHLRNETDQVIANFANQFP